MSIKLDKLNSTALTTVVTVGTWATLFGGSVVADFKTDVGDGSKSIGTSTDSAENIFQKIVNLLLFLIGATSVIMIIVGGIRFILSRGDPQAAATARNTVMYAVIGLIVAVLAYAIVNYVLGVLFGTGTSTAPTPDPPPPVIPPKA